MSIASIVHNQQAKGFLEALVRTTRHNIPEDTILQDMLCVETINYDCLNENSNDIYYIIF
jgi:hypothetical protein